MLQLYKEKILFFLKNIIAHIKFDDLFLAISQFVGWLIVFVSPIHAIMTAIVVLVISDLITAERFGVFEILLKQVKNFEIDSCLITQLTKQDLKVIKLLRKKIMSFSNLRVRNQSLGSPTFSRMVIRDDQEVILFTTEKANHSTNDTCLFTNSKSIIPVSLPSA